MNRLHKRECGFSLIELMSAIAISGVILGAITTSFISQSRSYDAQEQINEMQQGARASMDMITREVRMAGYNTNGALSFDGITYDTTQIRVQANLDGDGVRATPMKILSMPTMPRMTSSNELRVGPPKHWWKTSAFLPFNTSMEAVRQLRPLPIYANYRSRLLQ